MAVPLCEEAGQNLPVQETAVNVVAVRKIEAAADDRHRAVMVGDPDRPQTSRPRPTTANLTDIVMASMPFTEAAGWSTWHR